MRRMSALVAAVALIGVLVPALPAGAQLFEVVDVVATSGDHESRGEAPINCDPSGDCLDFGAEWTEPALPVQRRSVVDVRPLGAKVVAASAILARFNSNSYSHIPLGEATRTDAGAWAVQLPDELSGAVYLEVDFELGSGYGAFAQIHLDVVSGISDDELPPGVSGGGSWSGITGISVGVVLLAAAATAALAYRRRHGLEPTGTRSTRDS